MGVTISVAPAKEPLAVHTVKTHLRIDSNLDDVMIGDLIVSARMMAEQILNRALITQTLIYKIDDWPTGALMLPRAPVQSVTSVSYIDGAGASQVWDSANYDVFLDQWTPRIAPAYGVDWPSIRSGQNDAVSITYVAGYGDDGTDVPRPILQAMILMVDKLYSQDCDGAANGLCGATPMALLDLYRFHQI